jgi:hypothetical protein
MLSDTYRRDMLKGKSPLRCEMRKGLGKLTLDRQVTYEIKVPGELDASWIEWAESMTLKVDSEGDDIPITTLTGRFDQAGLQGILRRLYSLGLPLISVICAD